MLYQILGLCFGLLAILVLLMGLRVLIRRGWFMVWLRGSLGFALVALAVTLGLVAADLHSYNSLEQENRVATLSLRELAPQRFRVQVTMMDGGEHDYEVLGDMWQMDARLIIWKGALAAMGMKTAYRLDRLSGRYLAVEQERLASRTVYELPESRRGVDVWKWLYGQTWLPWVEANYGAAVYMPMKDGAEYMVSISRKGLLARPLNTIAMKAVDRWD